MTVEPWRIEAVALVIRCGMEHDGSEQDQAVDEDALRAIEATGYPAEVERLREIAEYHGGEIDRLRNVVQERTEDALRLRKALDLAAHWLALASLWIVETDRHAKVKRAEHDARDALARNAIRPMTEPIPTTCERQDCNEPVAWILHWEERGAPEPVYACWTHGMRSAVRREPVARNPRLSSTGER